MILVILVHYQDDVKMIRSLVSQSERPKSHYIVSSLICCGWRTLAIEINSGKKIQAKLVIGLYRSESISYERY
jgi:hypothetical protein